ncbi:MAG TPA: tetratricopeptide repeat protein [Ktedonobacteraceae bacterium]|nr:tetratricopeptide repeat protein [Ktedonobacteraceae bacterium]
MARESRCSDAAESLYQRVLAIREQALDSFHPSLAETLYSFAALPEAQECFQDAAALYQRALTIRELVYGPQHPKTIEARENYASLLREMER